MNRQELIADEAVGLRSVGDTLDDLILHGTIIGTDADDLVETIADVRGSLRLSFAALARATETKRTTQE